MNLPAERPFTPRVPDEQVLAAVDKHWRRYYTSPTTRWLQKELGYHTNSAIWYRLTALDVQGKIIFRDGHAIPFWVIKALTTAKEQE